MKNDKEQLSALLTIQKETIYSAEKSSIKEAHGLPGLTHLSTVSLSKR